MKPRECPFCGCNKIELKEINSLGGYIQDRYLLCVHCRASGPRFNDSKDKAFNSWNKRKEE